MENSSLWSDFWNYTSSSLPEISSNVQNRLYTKVIYPTIGIVGVFDNLFVIIVFVFFTKVTDKTMNILIVNQSVIDTLASFFSILLLVDMKHDGLSHDSIYDQFMCRFWLPRKPLWCMLVTSTYGTVLMALSRYIAVIYPIYYKKMNITKRLVYGSVVFIWIAVPALEITFTVFTNYISVDGKCVKFPAYISYASKKTTGIAHFCFTYLMPIMVMAFCYARLVHELRTKTTSVENPATTKAGRNAIVTSILVCCGFVLCWSFGEIRYFLLSFGIEDSAPAPFHHFSVVLRFTNSCMNPFIYAAKYGEFQKGVRRMFDRITRNAHQIHPQHNTSGNAVATHPTNQQI